MFILSTDGERGCCYGVCRCKKSSASVKSLEQSREIVLAVLSHNVDAVRLRAYHAMFNIVKVSSLVTCSL